jgi:hypothetical protein
MLRKIRRAGFAIFIRPAQCRYTALKEGIFTHPTLAEALNTLFTTLDS